MPHLATLTPPRLCARLYTWLRAICLCMLRCLFPCLFLAACAGGPAPAVPPDLFVDARFRAPSEPVDAGAALATSDAMRAYLRSAIAPQARLKGPRHALFDALYGTNQLKLEYDAALTRNAAQTFDARAGNCLSLVLMTAALAKEMGLQVSYQSVQTDESWSRSGELYFVSEHVNLVLGKRLGEPGAAYDAGANMTIDFLPPPDTRGYRTRPIEEATIVAMYLNNRAAETLAQDRLDDAYWWARAAIVRDPGFSGAYNTLGVLLRRHGDLEAARRAFTVALDKAPSDTRVMYNLAHNLRALGREAEAEALLAQLARLQPRPPFHFFNLGMAALRAGDPAAAVRLFSQEIERDPYYHEFHFWLAQAYARLGQLERVRAELGLALDNSTTRRDQQLYAAKLDRIRALPAR